MFFTWSAVSRFDKGAEMSINRVAEEALGPGVHALI